MRLPNSITTLTVAFCIALPVCAQAQRMDALRMGVALNGTAGSIYEQARSGDSMSDPQRPGLGRHSLYGALAGVALWGVYFALPCDAGCRTEGSREERLVLLPAAVLTGSAAGFLVGLIRGAR